MDTECTASAPRLRTVHLRLCAPRRRMKAPQGRDSRCSTVAFRRTVTSSPRWCSHRRAVRTEKASLRASHSTCNFSCGLLSDVQVFSPLRLRERPDRDSSVYLRTHAKKYTRQLLRTIFIHARMHAHTQRRRNLPSGLGHPCTTAFLSVPSTCCRHRPRRTLHAPIPAAVTHRRECLCNGEVDLRISIMYTMPSFGSAEDRLRPRARASWPRAARIAISLPQACHVVRRILSRL